jgi:hypothetical protein
MSSIEQAKKTWISAAKFAKLLGASRQAVSKAIFTGRISQSIQQKKCYVRKRYLINVYYGLLEWNANTDPNRPATKHINLHEILSSPIQSW